MVGIPGKSKGCHTCRRRKIGCDLQQPKCGRCTKGGRKCEGYNRGLVFLNRTERGLERRARLEEVQPRVDLKQPINLGSLQVSHLAVMRTKIQSIFLEHYLPTQQSSSGLIASAWLYEAVQLNDPSQALAYSLHALCITRVGRMSHNQDLVARGKEAYCRALRELQTALYSKQFARKDDALAACLTLATYELFESTSIAEHRSHISGVERLVEYRGFGDNESPLLRALMTNICQSSMVQSLQYRKASAIKGLLDRMNLWNIPERNECALYIHGLTTGALLEELDRCTDSGLLDISTSSEFLGKFLSLDAELESWYQDLVKLSPSPMFWNVKSESKNEPRLSFANLRLAHVITEYWAVRLILSITVDSICTEVARSNWLEEDSSLGHLACAFDKTESPMPVHNAVSFMERAKEQYGSGRFLDLSSKIMGSVTYCMSDENGLCSAKNCFFAGRVALFILRRYPSDHLPSCEALFMDLEVKKGFLFAQYIAKGLDRWDVS